jgi:predicted nucleic acid-binding protein
VIAYFDTSAVVPLLIEEFASDNCQELWNSAEVVVSTQLVHVEVSAALARAQHQGRIGVDEREDAIARLEALWERLSVTEVDESLVRRASQLAWQFALCGYDAVHCAAAEQLADVDLVAVSGDRELLEAWSSLGINVIDTSVV